MSRTERHREMAEQALTGHQELTRAHVEGRTPTPTDDRPARKVIFFTPQSGEREVDWGGGMRSNRTSIRELEMYWQRIPDFGIERFRIYPSETGWVQVVYWGGTSEDGRHHRREEVDVVDTDEDGNVIRWEAHSDKQQWMDLVAIATTARSSSSGATRNSSPSHRPEHRPSESGATMDTDLEPHEFREGGRQVEFYDFQFRTTSREELDAEESDPQQPQNTQHP